MGDASERTPVTSDWWEGVLAARGLASHPSAVAVWSSTLASLNGLVFDSEDRIVKAEESIDACDWPLLPNLLPLMPVDERSYACVVLSDVDGPQLPGAGAVVRWHTDVKDERHQATLLDTDCFEYVVSMGEELDARQCGLDRIMDEIGPAYQELFIAKEKRPRDFVVRPVRIACQNVIVALAAFNQDAAFDGLGVVAWQTCEVPHVATHEANRALTALTLCDAFKGGGTMEVRFDRPARVESADGPRKYRGHPEGRVPASLRRFGRTMGVTLGVEDNAAISPGEARELFRAVTPMPDELRERVDFATANEGIAPERLYYALMTGTWHPLELDFLLATTDRTASIVAGGASWHDRSARQAESEVCRASVMLSTLYKRLDNRDSAGSEVRVLEDNREGVVWHVDPDRGAVHLTGLNRTQPLPWTHHDPVASLTVFPRSLVTPATLASIRGSERAALLLPLDSEIAVPADVLVLRCPERLADLDKAVEAKLLTSRIARG